MYPGCSIISLYFLFFSLIFAKFWEHLQSNTIERIYKQYRLFLSLAFSSRSKQSHEKDDPPPPYSEVNTGSISKTRNNTTNGRGSVTNSSMSHTVQHTREMSAIQQQMQQELEEQKKLKEAQQKLNRIKQKTSEMELAKIRAENVKLREETIQTASKTRTFTQVWAIFKKKH